MLQTFESFFTNLLLFMHGTNITRIVICGKAEMGAKKAKRGHFGYFSESLKCFDDSVNCSKKHAKEENLLHIAEDLV